MEVTRIFDIIPRYHKLFPKDDVFAGKEDGEWIRYSTKSYIEISNDISFGLMALGIGAGDKVATITYNRPEWNFIDMGILQIGAVHVPVYPTISEADYRYILNHAEVKLVFVAGEDLYNKIEGILKDAPALKHIYTFKNLHGQKHLTELINLGMKNRNHEKLQAVMNSITTSDLATIIYTSGTTGIPKGVMLSHANIISNFKAVAHIPPVGPEGKALSYLPLCHIYERMLNYMYQYLGISVYYAENMGTIADNIREIRADILSTVPRLLEKIFDRIVNKGRRLKGLKKQIFFWSVNLGLKYELNGANGWWYSMRLWLANLIVFKKWREALGDNIKVIVSGGAALQPRLARVFWAARIPVLEGYGLTETSPVISVNHFGRNGIKFGTVGPPLENTRVKIADDGEVLCKGPGIMLGYFKSDELTKEVIDEDGWFHTGDVGTIEKEGHLKLTSRKKEIFKTSFGKYINPVQIEDKFKESTLIDNMMVVGENEKFAAALIVPDFTDLKSWCENKNIEYTSNSEMLHHPLVKQKFQRVVDKYNCYFGETEQIKRYEIMEGEWSTFTGELTPTLKLKREYIKNKFSDIIAGMFSNGSNMIDS